MKTYIHPLTLRTVRLGLRRSGNGLWSHWDMMPSGTFYETSELPHARALACHRCACHAVRDHGFYPLWFVFVAAWLAGTGACALILALLNIISN